MRRRQFIRESGLTLGAIAAAAACSAPRRRGVGFEADDWSSVRAQFALSPSVIHMSMFLLASHPRPVAAAIERHRRGLDEDPAGYYHENSDALEPAAREAAAEYMGCDDGDVALTDSTTMGLGLVYGSLRLGPRQEAVCTTHCHYSTQMSLQHRAERTGAAVRQVPLYANAATASVDEIVAGTRAAITDRTRVLAVTWVHSSTGVKLPIGDMAAAVRDINAGRDPGDRVLFCVDGVHGFGVEDVVMDDLGCDFFIAGTHKWICGPRGTGVVWARREAWEAAGPVIPSFSRNYMVWLGLATRDDVAPGPLNTPGGFHSFEHRWALPEAFRFHLDIGKRRVQERIHALSSMAKDAMAAMPHVTLHTPRSPELSSGIICFDVEGREPDAVVEHLHERKIIASRSPYRESHARIAPSMVNDEQEVERVIRVLREMA